MQGLLEGGEVGVRSDALQHGCTAARLQVVKRTTDGKALPNEGGEAGDGGALQREGHRRVGKWVSGLTYCNTAARLQAVKRMADGQALQCEVAGGHGRGRRV
jgi:hypothetical protein